MWHGGVPGLNAGDMITPQALNAGQHLRDDCPTCQARANGTPLAGDDNDPTLVYVTTDREYARLYAAGYPNGGLYVVEPVGELVDRGAHDPVPSWGCEAARVLSVYDPCVSPTAKEARRMVRRWLNA
ncbi:hypothetical protein BST26_21485 [Mycolicibacterium insubricum]|uniref:Uncharacterized protein n=3 Tax=Mycolicibacterium insubricum TaxID=444597 RepID=A0A1X0CLW5_9MYCO|nr:hypothetical protein [Mycolicibacterium insubricum]ORA60470.1 hypothetical protein BST26_21485 [Mycolicibacterium insubricum]